MKTLLIGLLLVCTTSVFSQTISEFERGYRAGMASCGATETSENETWECTLIYSTSDLNVTGVGNTKTEALKHAIKMCDKFDNWGGHVAESCRQAAGKNPRCLKL